MTELIYGLDPLCGWCYGLVPAMRRVAADHPDLPIRLVMAGLVTDERVGPYAEMEGYIRRASRRLREVTGRGPSEAFFRLIATPGVEGNSGPPSVAIAHVAGMRPERAVDFAHSVIEAHHGEGRDLNREETYAPLLAAVGLPPDLPDIHDPQLWDAVWEQGRRIGLQSFPTLAVLKDGHARVLPSEYDPERLSALVGQAAT
ncbi:hypothetical protein [Rubellimicrobium aerolatum]|uniref:DsbA family protein n=1 Tax=Rubellimicrobium aerolatum TaxID=490979 RepID=A0ABW0SDI3_9RHOB|nr:hypothetical protein [Rubellimicrobium aerolatum]MBP1805738.1 putative protein-disulfide isomerase [Rubellimicrobium aerolatum]